MITTIEQAFKPLFVTSSIIGLGFYSQERLKPYLSIFYSLTLWIIYISLCCYIVIALEAEEWFSSPFIIVNTYISIFTTMTSSVLVICYNKKFRTFMKRIAAIDDTLEELGTPKIYKKLHIWAKVAIILWFVCSLAANINDMMWWFYASDDCRKMILPYITNHFRHVNMFVDLLFIVCIWYIGTRFDKVNKHVKYLLRKEEHGLRCTWKKTVPITRQYIMCPNNYKRVLWTSMHLHLELCQIARDLNMMFGTQMTLEMTYYLLFLTGIFYYLYVEIINDNRYVVSIHAWFDVYFWASIYVSRLFYLNFVCEIVSTKANEIKRIIHQLTDSVRYGDIRDEICQFTLQLIYHPLKFTGMGLFYFGYSFIRKFFLTIVTFVVIIVQMSIPLFK